ncbi:MAG: hypothetical protein F6K44_33290, partial [Moorea sp. SIO3E2]|nr:hypothetical protein [Moorena sp. SIO3E2]
MGRWGKPVKVNCFSTIPDSRFPIPDSRFPVPDNCREVYYFLLGHQNLILIGLDDCLIG